MLIILHTPLHTSELPLSLWSWLYTVPTMTFWQVKTWNGGDHSSQFEHTFLRPGAERVQPNQVAKMPCGCVRRPQTTSQTSFPQKSRRTVQSLWNTRCKTWCHVAKNIPKFGAQEPDLWVSLGSANAERSPPMGTSVFDWKSHGMEGQVNLISCKEHPYNLNQSEVMEFL